MTVRKILMVEPKAPGNHVYSIVRLPRLGLAVLGNLASRRGCQVKIVIEEMTPLDDGLIAEADLVCISTITSTAPAAFRLADKARAAGKQAVVGGPHVTFLPDEALEHADWVIRGEGERTFGPFLDMLAGRLAPDEVQGLSFKRDGRIVHNPLPAEPVPMDEVPIPDFSLLVTRGKTRFDRGIVPVQTSRGCPHHCNFCSVTPMFGRRMRHASFERVAEMLRRGYHLGDKVFFYDDNFCAPPGRTKELLDYLLTRDVLKPTWFAQVSVKAAEDPELLALMQRAGCYTVFIGLESVQPETLAAYKKRQNLEDIRRAIRRFKRHGIWVHGMFVTGSDSDTRQTIRATGQFAIDEDIDTIQFMVLTPLPGTPVYEQMRDQGRLLTRDWAMYDAHHAVFQPANMTAHELMEDTMAAMGRVYAAKRILGRLLHGRVARAAFATYARSQVRRWFKENRALLREGRKAAGGDPFAAGLDQKARA